MSNQEERPPAQTGEVKGRRRRPLVGVSFKMYFDLPRTQSYMDQSLEEVSNLLDRLVDPPQVFFVPDFVTLSTVRSKLDSRVASLPGGSACSSSSLLLGAQDTHHEDSGAFTGEVSPKVLRQVGCDLVEIGHAERRSMFGEDDSKVSLKAAAICRNSMIPLVCVGELTRSEDVGRVVDECWSQIGPVLESIPDDSELILAYEPVWAIGKQQPASPDYVVAVTTEIRRRCVQLHAKPDHLVRILYGGSAGPGIFEKLKQGVDGLFLGRFAHDPKALAETVKEVGRGLKPQD
ncbi:Triosephosphate isomerase [Violaceomyces palustris]|uniref:Triosephosphate isomerase n=1 Tax=Violaceomyces palustris TaxID=1673888 RepID=A0ACD0NT95_9BASI|nr:Triosephosphate isomerase [Violaceomyces palustris]